MEKVKSKKSHEIKGEDFVELIKMVMFSSIGAIIFLFPIVVDKNLVSPVIYISEKIYFGNKKFIHLLIMSSIFLFTVKDLLKKKKTISLKFQIALRLLGLLVLLLLTLKSEIILFRSKNLEQILKEEIFNLIVLFPLSSLVLPMLLEYGVVNLLDGCMGKITRSIFKVSGKNILLIMIFLFVDKFLGFYAAYKLYLDGKLRNNEFINAVLNYGILSISLSLYTASKLDINKIAFIVAYLGVFLVSNIVIVRIYPTSSFVRSFYIKGGYKERAYRRDKLKLSTINYLENKNKKSILKHSLTYFNEAINIASNLLPVLIFSFLAVDFVVSTSALVIGFGRIYSVFFEFVKIPYAREVSIAVFEVLLNPIYSIEAIKNLDIASVSRFTIGVIAVCQSISLTVNLVFIVAYARFISLRDILIIYIEKVLIITGIVFLVYYCYMGFSL